MDKLLEVNDLTKEYSQGNIIARIALTAVDNISFYIHKEYGALARRKGGPTSEQVKTSSSFALTRKNNSEFGKASHYGKLLRLAFRPLINHCRETKLDTNLSSRLRAIIRMDTESEFGGRDLRRNTIQAFRHFELDSGCLSSQYFELPVPTVLKDKSVEVIAALRFSKRPPNVDAWKVKSVAVSLDLIAGTIESQVIESGLNDVATGRFAEAFTHHLAKEKQHLVDRRRVRGRGRDPRARRGRIPAPSGRARRPLRPDRRGR